MRRMSRGAPGWLLAVGAVAVFAAAVGAPISVAGPAMLRTTLLATAALQTATLVCAASDVTLKLNMGVFGLGGAADGGGDSTWSTWTDADGNIALIDSGAPATTLLSLTTLIPIPQSIQNGTNGSMIVIDTIPLLWNSPQQLAYHLSVTLADHPPYIANGWLAANVMDPPVMSVSSSGRLPANDASLTIGLNCQTEGKVRMQFQMKVCESAAASWANGACSTGTTQTVFFNVDKECGGGNTLPSFCSPISPAPLSPSAKAAAGVTVFNLNVAEGAGIDRTKFAAKGAAVAAKVISGGFDVFAGQEIWDEEDRAAMLQGLAASGGPGGGGLTEHVSARLSGLMIASRYPILRWCVPPTAPASPPPTHPLLSAGDNRAERVV
eukprot:COSAG05_NODE_2805_length_2619_cov_1.669841_1_plen_380_part_00